MSGRLVVDKANAAAVIAQGLHRAQTKERVARQSFDPELGATPEQAEERAAKCRQSLAEYTRYVLKHEPAAHHLLWIDALEKMERRELRQRKLLLLAPPNMAKSTYVSNAFVKWYLGRHPDHNVLALTSADTNAGFFGGAVKEGLAHDTRHKNVFPALACRPNFKRGWSGDGCFLLGTPSDQPWPAYRSVGWGATIMGQRANLIIVDDPLSQKQAESPTEQRFSWRYLEQTVTKRLQRPDDADTQEQVEIEEEGILVAVMTRWVEDDLAGKIKEQAEENPNEWLVIELPGLAEEDDPLGRGVGEPLWETRFPLDFYLREKAKDEATFQIVYQHNPLAAGGDVFKDRSKFRPLPAEFYFGVPSHPSMYDRSIRFMYVDPAFSKLDSACYSVILTVCIDANFNMYIVDVRRLRGEPYVLEAAMVDAIATNKPHAVVIERSAFRASTVRQIAFNVMRRAMCQITDLPSTEDKILRARLPAGRVENGLVYIDLDAPWATAFVNECMGFPKGKYMDQVDAFSGAAEMVLQYQIQYQQNQRPRKLVYGG